MSKKIYFTRDFSSSNVETLKSDGWILRAVIQSETQIEDADIYGGEIPKCYDDFLKKHPEKLYKKSEVVKTRKSDTAKETK